MSKKQHTPLETLKKMIAAEGSQKAVADLLKINPQYLSDILNGRRDISERIANALGFVKRVTFEEKSNGKRTNRPS